MKIYSVYEVCEMLSVTRKTINKYIASGDLKVIRLGNQVRVSEEALNSFLESKTVKVLDKPIDTLTKK